MRKLFQGLHGDSKTIIGEGYEAVLCSYSFVVIFFGK